MIEEIKNIKSEKSDLRKFGITVGLVFLLIAGLLFWKEKSAFPIFLGIGLILCVSGAALPFILKPVYRVWMILALILGWFMTRVILSLLFYAVLTPLGLVLRLFGKRFLDLSGGENKETYWNYRTAKSEDEMNYDKQF